MFRACQPQRPTWQDCLPLLKREHTCFTKSSPKYSSMCMIRALPHAMAQPVGLRATDPAEAPCPLLPKHKTEEEPLFRFTTRQDKEDYSSWENQEQAKRRYC